MHVKTMLFSLLCKDDFTEEGSNESNRRKTEATD